jgi:hypothetical protein
MGNCTATCGGHDLESTKAETQVSAFEKSLAATYSRAGYTTTTIGNAVFHGRVRNGNGWDHCFMTTRKSRFVERLASHHGPTGREDQTTNEFQRARVR